MTTLSGLRGRDDDIDWTTMHNGLARPRLYVPRSRELCLIGAHRPRQNKRQDFAPQRCPHRKFPNRNRPPFSPDCTCRRHHPPTQLLPDYRQPTNLLTTCLCDIGYPLPFIFLNTQETLCWAVAGQNGCCFGGWSILVSAPPGPRRESGVGEWRFERDGRLTFAQGLLRDDAFSGLMNLIPSRMHYAEEDDGQVRANSPPYRWLPPVCLRLP